MAKTLQELINDIQITPQQHEVLDELQDVFISPLSRSDMAFAIELPETVGPLRQHVVAGDGQYGVLEYQGETQGWATVYSSLGRHSDESWVDVMEYADNGCEMPR